MRARGAAAALRAIDRAAARQRKPDLVLSRLQVPGIFARDTRMVFDELLHAKAVVVDDEALFITSANLTEAAGERNIEIGVLLRDRSMALTVVSYFQRMIDGAYLRLLPE